MTPRPENRRTSALALLLALTAWGLPAQASESKELPRELIAVIEQARVDRLPSEPLVLKAQEGMAKNIPVPRIQAALAAELESFGAARQAAPTLGAAALPAAGRAVRAGASAGAVRAMAEVTEPGRSFDAMADLLNAGLPEGDAVVLVRTAATGRGPDAALSGLATAVAAMLRNGHAPAEVVERLQAIVAQGGSPLSVLPDLPSQVPPHANAWDNQGKGKGTKGPPSWAGEGKQGKGKGAGN